MECILTDTDPSSVILFFPVVGGGGGKLGTLVGKLNLTRKRNSSGRGPNFI